MRFNHNSSFALDYLAMDGERLTEAETGGRPRWRRPAPWRPWPRGITSSAHALGTHEGAKAVGRGTPRREEG